jgi:oxygen-dependent protoporphyrinogen oxidase
VKPVGETQEGQARLLVVGGGLTGLAAAHRAVSRAGAAGRRPGLDVILLEARDRLGGAVWTTQQDGFSLEGGADSFITNKPWAVDLCRELGLGGRLIETDNRHRRSFVVHSGRLVPVPEGFVLMAPSRLLPLLTTPVLSLKGKLRLLLDLAMPRRQEDTDESLAAFVRRRLGREALDRLVQPLVGGIYTADPNELSLKATLPQFASLEREHGSLILAAFRQARAARSAGRNASGARYGLFLSIDEGMGTLPRTLAESLPPGSIRMEAPVRRISRATDRERPWVAELLDGSVIRADSVIVTTEAHASARLLDGLDPGLALQLRSIPYASSAIVQVGYRRDQISHPLDGFGAVVPAVEDRPILAISFLSVKFPSRAPSGTVLMRVFVGGATQPSLFEMDDDEMGRMVLGQIEELLGARGEPILMEVARHPRGMPQYALGHLDRVASIRQSQKRHPGLFLAGNAFEGVGIPDCVRSGREAADSALALLQDASKIAAA